MPQDFNQWLTQQQSAFGPNYQFTGTQLGQAQENYQQQQYQDQGNQAIASWLAQRQPQYGLAAQQQYQTYLPSIQDQYQQNLRQNALSQIQRGTRGGSQDYRQQGLIGAGAQSQAGQAFLGAQQQSQQQQQADLNTALQQRLGLIQGQSPGAAFTQQSRTGGVGDQTQAQLGLLNTMLQANQNQQGTDRLWSQQYGNMLGSLSSLFGG
jgi:hypothetical protein